MSIIIIHIPLQSWMQRVHPCLSNRSLIKTEVHFLNSGVTFNPGLSPNIGLFILPICMYLLNLISLIKRRKNTSYTFSRKNAAKMTFCIHFVCVVFVYRYNKYNLQNFFSQYIIIIVSWWVHKINLSCFLYMYLMSFYCNFCSITFMCQCK